MLDLGCGAGNNSLKILQLNPNIHCDLLDLSAPILERARVRVSEVCEKEVRVFKGDFRKVPLEGGYDIIVAAAVLHHLRDAEDWERAFDKIHNLLNEGGVLLVSDLVKHSSAPVDQMMWSRYGDYLEGLGGEEYRAKVFGYIDHEDSPRPLGFQLQLLHKFGFSEVDVLHKNSLFAAYYAVK